MLLSGSASEAREDRDVGPLFRASLVIKSFSVLVQLKQKRLCECFRAWHAFCDHARCCASIRCGMPLK